MILRWAVSVGLTMLALAALIIAVAELGYGLQGYRPAWIAFMVALLVAGSAVWGARSVVRATRS